MTLLPPVVHIVDDDDSFRKSLERLMEISGFRSAGYGSSDEFLASRPTEGPACVLLDLNLPGQNGLDLQLVIKELRPNVPVVFLTGFGTVPSSVRAMRAGAEDFLEKNAPTADLLASVQRAIDRSRQLIIDHDRRVALTELFGSLTPREMVVFQLVVQGRRNKEIAYEIGTTERTVKAHRRNIMEKLRARSWAEAIVMAEKLWSRQGANADASQKDNSLLDSKPPSSLLK
jgi:FixJ family two-component response regulator